VFEFELLCRGSRLFLRKVRAHGVTPSWRKPTPEHFFGQLPKIGAAARLPAQCLGDFRVQCGGDDNIRSGAVDDCS